jgi:ferric-dicitrate binding protein FerR (iron transport regulator)
MSDGVVEKRQSRRTLGWLLEMLLGVATQTATDPARVTPTLRHRATGETRQITLAGDHKPVELEISIAEGRFDR